MPALVRNLGLFVAVLVAFAGCGDDSDDGGPTEPSGPSNANVAGNWTYNASNMAGTLSGVTVSCSVGDLLVTLNQTGATFTGSTSGGTLSCMGGGQSISEPLGTVTVVNGSVDGNSVSFDFGTSDWRHQGTKSGTSMNGTVTVSVQLDDQVVILNGNWAAALQSSIVLGEHRGALDVPRTTESVGESDWERGLARLL